MPCSGGFRNGAGYNAQVAFDAKHKLIAEQHVTNAGSDLGLLAPTAGAAKEVLGVERIDAIADRGYYKGEDIQACEDGGIEAGVARMICDIIIPVRNQDHWVALCVKELLANTPTKSLGDVLLVDDASYSDARAKIGRIATTNDAVRLLRQDRRGGFASAVNRGLGETSAPFVLLLNSDCLLTRDAVPKLIAHFRKDERIGLVSPFSNNSAPLTIPLARGWTYQGMNSLLEEHFAGEIMEACTIVGNALMISRECLEKAGSLDQASYGIGYFEETDYQFRAMRVGFTAAAALDTYVYHHGGASFGVEARFMKRANREKFFSIWGHEYGQLAQRSPPYKPSHKVMSRLNSHIILGSLASRHRIHRQSAYSRLNVL